MQPLPRSTQLTNCSPNGLSTDGSFLLAHTLALAPRADDVRRLLLLRATPQAIGRDEELAVRELWLPALAAL